MNSWRQFRYYVGLLMKDRQRDPSVDTLADFWWSRRDRYRLVQRRIKDNVYEYYAIPIK